MEVQRIGGQCLQVLLSAKASWADDDRELIFERPFAGFYIGIGIVRRRIRLITISERVRFMIKTVLTVDDSRTMRDMLRLSLEGAGFRVVQAEDGLHGLEVLAGEMPDVIVTDINMPRMDGFGFIEAVRRDATRRSTPVLVLTTEVDAEKKSRAKAAGATGWIVKPFDPIKLVDAIRRVAN